MKSIRNLSDKSKRLIVIAGCTVLCTALVIAIASRFQSKAKEDESVPSSSSSASVVTPAINSDTSSTMSASSNTESETGSATAKTDQSDQDLQSKVTKPTTPDSETKNSNSKPSSSSKSSTSSTPKAGTKNGNGQTYVLGFGYVSDGGANTGTTVGNSGDQLTGNKVGNMD